MSIAEVQTRRKIVLGVAILFGILMLAFSRPIYPNGSPVHETIERAGIVAIIVCILGRTWASLYIGSCKIEQLVTDGPYSVTRNPLYFFSILGAAGAGAQLGSAVAALTFGAVAWLVFYVEVLQEERLLADRYGAAFADYAASVPRFLPNLRLWRDLPTPPIMPPKMIRTFADAMLMLLTVPMAEIFEHLQNIGVLPVLLHLP